MTSQCDIENPIKEAPVMGSILVVGLGEVGKPLLEVISQQYDAIGIDIEPVEVTGECEIMHVCYPFGIADFISLTVAYIDKYKPRLTVIDSTVAPGTTRAVHQATGAPIAYSPVRGKHFKMKQELLHYTKFVGGINQESGQRAAAHFESLGMKTRILASPEAAELAKLTETTYFGLMIAWAQEVERYCDKLSLDYDEIVAIYEEIGFFPPVKYIPGVIGGHCVMPNIKILKAVFHSGILDAIESSNQLKIQRDAPHSSGA
jgi:UDP-N-acetyl-D-mannosaminuronate dehydrogenase